MQKLLENLSDSIFSSMNEESKRLIRIEDLVGHVLSENIINEFFNRNNGNINFSNSLKYLKLLLEKKETAISISYDIVKLIDNLNTAHQESLKHTQNKILQLKSKDLEFIYNLKSIEVNEIRKKKLIEEESNRKNTRNENELDNKSFCCFFCCKSLLSEYNFFKKRHDKLKISINSKSKNIHIVCANRDNTLKVWDVNSNTVLKTLAFELAIQFIVKITNSIIAICFFQGVVKIFNIDTNKFFRTITPIPNPEEHQVSKIIRVDDDTIAIATSLGTLIFYNVNTGKRLKTLKLNKDPLSVVEKISKYIYAISSVNAKNFELWNIQSINVLKYFKGHKFTSHTLMKMTPTLIVSSSVDEIIIIFNLLTGREVKILPCSGSYFTTMVKVNKNVFASTNSGTTICLWDVYTGAQLKVMKGHKSTINDLACIDENRLVSGSDNVLIVWDLNSGKSLNTMNEKGNRRLISLLTLKKP